MNRGIFKVPWKRKIINIFYPDYIMDYLLAMRKCSYYEKNNTILYLYYRRKYMKLGIKLGFSIGYNVFGYGLVLPHYGTIVVGGNNDIGNFCVLHTSTCISANDKHIGDGLYLATGAKLTTQMNLGNNISVGANSLVNKSFDEDNILIGGIPASKIKKTDAWYIRDGQQYFNKVKKVENLKKELNIEI